MKNEPIAYAIAFAILGLLSIAIHQMGLTPATAVAQEEAAASPSYDVPLRYRPGTVWLKPGAPNEGGPSCLTTDAGWIEVAAVAYSGGGPEGLDQGTLFGVWRTPRRNDGAGMSLCRDGQTVILERAYMTFLEEELGR